MVCAWLRPPYRLPSFSLEHFSSKTYPFFWPAFYLHVLAELCLAAGRLGVYHWLFLPFSLPCPLLLSTCSSLLFRLSSSRVAFSMSHAKELSSVLFRICNSVLLYSDIISSIYSSLGNCSARFSMLTPFLPPFLFLQCGPWISLELESLRQICRLPPWKGAKHLGTSELIRLLVSFLVSVRLRFRALKQGGRQESLAGVKKEKHVTNQ